MVDVEPSDYSDFCAFFMENIGAAPVDTMREHIAQCSDCQKALEIAWQGHSHNEDVQNCFFGGEREVIFNLDGISRDLSQDEFLVAWHIAVTKRLEVYEHRAFVTRKRLNSDEGCRWLMRLLRRQTRMFLFIGFNADTNSICSSIEILEETYRKLKDFLGEHEMAYLLDQDPEDFEIVLRGIRKIASLFKATEQ